ncbi:MAG TPA: hypothetical protein VLF69_05255 [Candidatus Saccharimonadales bacterium]|nr:hypothetical protein [Candidatus Saccharimonadales bacterium]
MAGMSNTVSAHVLRYDGAMSVELHIEPDDAPISNTPTHYILSFSDSNGQFDLSHCRCQVGLLQGNKTIITSSLIVSTPQVSRDVITFPEPGAYTLRLSGMPKQPGAFQPFRMSWPVRVGSDPNKKPFPWPLGVAIGVGIGLLIGSALVMEYRGKRHQKH